MYCIIVKVELNPGARTQFLEVMLNNASSSVKNEPGCMVFDVLEAREEQDTFYLYEIYADQDALQSHKQTAHYQSTRAVINDLIAKQSVIRADVLARNPG